MPQLVQPGTDLGLKEIQKALEIKNAKIEQSYINIQANISKASKLDVLRGTDKDYIQSQLNLATDQLTNMGGDLSDPRYSIQANSIIDNIYNDKNIQSALISTANIRNVQKQREQINTNPKLKDYVSNVNENYDNELINNYIKSGKIGEMFSLKGATLGVNTEKLYNDAAKATQIKNTEKHKKDDPLVRYAVKERTAADVATNVMSTMSSNADAYEQEKRNFAYTFKDQKGFVDRVNSSRDENIKALNNEIVRLDTIADVLKKEGKTDQIKEYEEVKKGYLENIEVYKEGKLDLSDPNLAEKAFNVYRADKAMSYGNKYKVYEQGPSSIDPVAKFRIEREDRNNQNIIANAFRQQQLDIQRANSLSKQSKKALDKISPGAAKEYDETGKVKMPLEDQYASAEATLDKEFDGVKAYSESLKSLKDQNVKLASEIIYTQSLQGGAVADKLKEFIDKQYIVPMVDNKGRTIKSQYLFGNYALTQISALLDHFDSTQGQVFSAQNARTKEMIDQIAINNFKYGVLEAQKNEIFKKYGVSEQDIKNYGLPVKQTSPVLGGGLMGPMTTYTGTGQLTQGKSKNLEGAKKEMNKLMQSTGLTAKVPIASLNFSESGKGDFSDLRQQLINEANNVGVYSTTNPSLIYSLNGYINGQPTDKNILGEIVDKDNKERKVDWNKSLANVIPGQQEVIYELKDKEGNIIKTKEFPNGQLVVKVKKTTVNALLDAVESGRTIDDFGDSTKIYDDLIGKPDNVVNSFTGKTLYPITGLSTKYNIKFSIKKSGDRFEIGIPALGQTLLYGSIDQFNKNFSTKFQEILRRIEVDPEYKAYRDLSVQEKSNIAVETLKKEILYKGTI
jgi:hypothetical protein